MADIKLIAEALIGISLKEVQELMQVLKDEYGIDAVVQSVDKADAEKMFIDVQKIRAQSEPKREIIKNPKIFVPRVIGKPCKPYVSRRK